MSLKNLLHYGGLLVCLVAVPISGAVGWAVWGAGLGMMLSSALVRP